MGMMVRIWRKPDTQKFIKSLAKAGYSVVGDGLKYECFNGDDLVFAALIGRNGYLCRINEAYVTEPEAPIAVI